MINPRDYDKIITEHFDITHDETRKVLLNINEADQNQVLTALTSRLYEIIVDKVDDIDYGTIPNSKGDITMVENFDKLLDCTDVIESLLKEYKQDIKPIKTIKDAIENVRIRKELFEKGFRYQVELPMITYSTIVLSIIASTSFLISTCIEFIKIPSQEEFGVILDKVALVKTKSNVLFNSLENFNKACDKKQLDNCLEVVIKNNMKNLTGVEVGFVVGGIAMAGLILNIIPILRELIFFFYYTRTRISDYFDIQADLLQMNAYAVQNNDTMKKADRDKIAKKQMKVVELFRKISNKVAIDVKESEAKATKEIIKTSSEKVKTSDLMDSVPDSASSALF